MKNYNANQLKYLALAFMTLDSIFFAFPNSLPSWIHLLTRFVAPLFAFFTVEGFFHTRNRHNHLRRLWLAAILMQCGDFISFFIFGLKHQITDNIFLTLALGYTVIYLLQKGKEGSKKFYYMGTLVFLLGLVLSILPLSLGAYQFALEGGLPILFTILIFWAFYDKRRKQVLAFLAWNGLYLLLALPPLPGGYPALGLWFEEFCYNSDSLTFLFLPLLLLYNGEKGSSKPMHKWFFYIYYPLHLWVLYILAFFLIR
ncbi:TraX family protein [Streptococcus macacae NCTC 11558]|uniref:Protein TraX n=1 Tax=Streptococcus macacae NCTC 11558 TaxID=764298 RepID=G5JW35_9STRE|nr:protein TraX [Streptococcus macacae NCTC 11558]SUN79371.1 TraX family protein [Streptococcus macacae NCTC 11558]